MAVVVWGIAAAWYYAINDLTLSHYDAKAHLVVARRVIDNITPGWQQIGAVWLPLPHVLNLLPVQVDWFYRTGVSGVAISILSLAFGGYALVRMIARETGSSVGAVTALVLLISNPNLLYLQSTPMTELAAPVIFSVSAPSPQPRSRIISPGLGSRRVSRGSPRSETKRAFVE